MSRYSEHFSVGLTGGIGSGKTTVTDHFSKLGAGIVDADEVSRSLTGDNQPAVDLIAQTFGSATLIRPGVLNRDQLREIVFNDATKKHQLEKILHPLIRSQMRSIGDSLDKPYLIFSIPLLIESNQQTSFDRILVINAPDSLRQKWIKQRSGLDDQQILKIMASQTSATDRLAHADDVIENNDTVEHVYQQVEKLHHFYLSRSTQ